MDRPLRGGRGWAFRAAFRALGARIRPFGFESSRSSLRCRRFLAGLKAWGFWRMVSSSFRLAVSPVSSDRSRYGRSVLAAALWGAVVAGFGPRLAPGARCRSSCRLFGGPAGHRRCGRFAGLVLLEPYCYFFGRFWSLSRVLQVRSFRFCSFVGSFRFGLF